MAVTSSSSRDEIRDYQKELNDAGAQPPLVVDGLWGPKTQAAHDSNGSDTSSTDSDDSTINEDLEGSGTGARFGIPNGAEIWRNSDSGEIFLVYMVPGTEADPAYMKWYIPDEESLQSFFGPDQPIKHDKDIAGTHDLWTDAVSFGTTNEIPPGNEAPFAAWTETLETESAIQPWILDDDYQKLFAMAIVEGRGLTEAELASTNWYSTHSVAERNWLREYHGDPSSAQQTIDNNRLSYGEYMRDAGMGNVDEKLVNYMSDQVSKGLWTDIELQHQVQVLSDPYFEGWGVDPGLQTFIDDNSIAYSQTRDQENEVRNTVERWLGTNFGKWDDATVSRWASQIRNDPSSMERLTETLKDQRLALFPEYDREADYATISAPWRNMIQNQWGEIPDDSDRTLQSIIKMNDATQAGEFLTTEGLARGNQQVVNGVQSALNRSFGGM